MMQPKSMDELLHWVEYSRESHCQTLDEYIAQALDPLSDYIYAQDMFGSLSYDWLGPLWSGETINWDIKDKRSLLRANIHKAMCCLNYARPSGGQTLHSAFVTKFAMEIGVELSLGTNSIIKLALAAMYHDTGFALIPPERKKIKKSEIETIDDPREKEKTRQKAIHIRQEHMEIGADIAKSLIRQYDATDVCRMISMHDNPTIAELVDNPKEKMKWLFGFPLPDKYVYNFGDTTKHHKAENLVILLREADRLWMLTFDGIMSDLASADPAKRKTPLEQLEYNISRHVDEGNLYRKLFGSTLDGLDPDPRKPFYRSRAAWQLFAKIVEETREKISELKL